MRPSMRRRLFAAALTLLVAAALLWGFWPRARPVEVARVARGPMEVALQEEGKTRVIDRFVVSAPVAGFMRRVTLRVGDRVERGQPLVAIEPPRARVLDPRSRAEAQARVSGASAGLRAAQQEARAARAEADFARAEYERIAGLARQRFVTRAQEEEARARMESAEAARRSAEFSIEVARHELEAARTALRFSGAAPHGDGLITIASPVRGRLLRLQRESEGNVEAGQPIMEIGDPTALEVVTDLLSADAVRVHPGMRVVLDRWGGEQPLSGSVRRVEPVGFTKVSALGVEEQRVNVISAITSPADLWTRLGDSYRVETRFILWEGRGILQIPASALFRQDDGWALFRVVAGRARRQEVRIGQRGGLVVQILDGVAENDLVITHPDETIHEGVAVDASE